MSKNTKSKLDTRIEVAFLYLKEHCEANGVLLKRKFIEVNNDKVVLICGADNGTYASIGIDKEDGLRIYMQDQKIYRWGKLEGFTEDEIYDKLNGDLIKETDLISLAGDLIK
jgi:hypothetical protein